MTDPKLATRRTYRITVDVEVTLASGPDEGSAGASRAEARHHHGDLVGYLLDRPELLEGLPHSSAINALGGHVRLAQLWRIDYFSTFYDRQSLPASARPD